MKGRLHGSEPPCSHKVLSYGQHLGILAFPLAKAGWDGCFNPSPHRVPIVLDEDHVVGVKPWSHPGARHAMPHNECSLLLPPDGQQDLIADLAHPTLVVDVDAPRRPMVGAVPQGTVVHYAHPSHLLDCPEAPRGASGREKESVTQTSLGTGHRSQTAGRCTLATCIDMHVHAEQG